METQIRKISELIDVSQISRTCLKALNDELSGQDMVCMGIIDLHTFNAARLLEPVHVLSSVLGEVRAEVTTVQQLVDFISAPMIAGYDRDRLARSMGRESLTRKLRDHDLYSFVVKIENDADRVRVMKHTFVIMDDDRRYLMWNMTEITSNLEYDVLTGGRNREGLLHKLQLVLGQRDRADDFSLLYFDMQSFHHVNELYGHEMGDAVLRDFYTAMVYSDLKPLVYGRSESDHFFCLVRRENVNTDVITSLCRRELLLAGKSVPYHCICGIYHITDPKEAPATMCGRASIAANYVRDAFSKPWREFDETIRQRYVADGELLDRLDSALASREIQPYYQPIVDVRTGRVVMAEALVRWVSERYGFVSPADFIPSLEKHGLISQVDRYMTERVFSMLRSRLRVGRHVVPVDVNVSWVDFGDADFVAHLENCLNDKEVSTDLCRYEITESTLAQMSRSRSKQLEMMSEHHACLLIDDFGKGYSFSSMRNVEFCIVKIDKSLIDDIGHDKKSDILVDTFIGMFHKMGAKVVAEGVETKEQVEYLRRVGCDYIQGFYFYRPMPENDFLKLLDEQKPLDETELQQDVHEESVWIEREVLEKQYASLKESDEKGHCLRMIMASEGIHYFEWDVRTHVDVCSDSFKNLYGMPSNEIQNMPEVADLCHPDDRDRFREFYYRAERGERMGTDFFRILSPDGKSYSWYRKTFYTLFDKNDQPFKVILTMQDCADRYKHLADIKRNDLLVRQQGVITFNYTVASDRLEITYVDETGAPKTLILNNYTSEKDCPEAMDQDILAVKIEILKNNDEQSGYFDYDDVRFNQTLRVHYSKVQGEYGTLYAIVGQAESILRTREKLTETIRAQKEFISMTEGLSKIYNAVSTVSLTEKTSNILLLDKSYEGILNKEMSWKEVAVTYADKLIKPAYHDAFLKFMDSRTVVERLKGKRYISMEYEDDALGWVRGYLLPSGYDEDGKISNILFASQPIGSEKSTIDHLIWLSETDTLTGVRNRYSGEKLVEQAIKEKRKGVFAIIDCDKFKVVNDTYGHTVGDKYLQTVANCLRENNAEGVTMRLGGDEFALYMYGNMMDYEVQLFFDHLFSKLMWQQVEGMNGMRISVSVGAVRYDGYSHITFDSLYRMADSLLYQSKKTPGCKLTM